VTTGQTFHCKAVVPVDVTQLDQNGNLRWQITNLSGNAPGATGATGVSAPIGPTLGTSGLTGVTGASGARGPTFPVGASGPTSPSGQNPKSEGRFKAFRNTGEGYSISFPGGWIKSGNGPTVQFNAPLGDRFASIGTVKQPTAPTAKGLKEGLQASKGVTNPSGATRVKVGGTSAFLITYTQQSGKFTFFIRRYVFWRKGKGVTLNIGAPPKNAQVPNFQRNITRIANSFRWL
jgi:hypothetical protein